MTKHKFRVFVGASWQWQPVAGGPSTAMKIEDPTHKAIAGWIWAPDFEAACKRACKNPVFNEHGNWMGPTATANSLPLPEFIDWLVYYSGLDLRSIKP